MDKGQIAKTQLGVRVGASGLYVRTGLGIAAAATALLASASAGAAGHGKAVAAGDFNGSGGWIGNELAIGAPFDNWGGSQTGSVAIYWRNPSGSDNWAVDWLSQDRLNGSLFTGANDGGLEDWDAFGSTLAVGDFDGDGYKDLAIAAPYEGVGSASSAGCVHVLYGTASGGPNGMPFRQQTAYLTRENIYPYPLPAVPSDNDYFGWSLVAGDFDGNGLDDLAVGAPGVTVNGQGWAGAVFVFYSSGGTGFSSTWEYTLHQGGPYSPSGSPQAGDSFGWALAAGNFNGDLNGTTGGGTGPNGTRRIMDLAVSAIGESVGGNYSAGNVSVYYGRPWINFDTSNNWVIDQASLELPEQSDSFGYSLAAGDFNSSCSTANPYTCTSERQDDLAIGVPWESIGNVWGAGIVHVLYGTTAGLSTANAQIWNSASFSKPFLATPVEEWAGFGYSLAAGDVIGEPNGGCQGNSCNPLELVIGEPYRDRFGANNSGRGYVLRGSSGGFLSANHDFPFIEPWSYTAESYYTEALAVGVIGNYPGQPGDSINSADVLVGAPGADQAFVHYGSGYTVASSQPKAFPFPW